MAEEAVELLYDNTRTRRVIIYRHSTGTFGYREEKYFKNELAETEGWATITKGKSSYDTLETALREVTYNISWLLQHSDK